MKIYQAMFLRYSISILIVFILIMSNSLLLSFGGELLSEKDYSHDIIKTLWEKRDDPVEAKKLVYLLEERVSNNLKSEEDWTWLTMLFWWLGYSNDDRDQRMEYFKKGVDAGEKAVELNNDNVAGNYWLAANIGEYSKEKGIVSSIRHYTKIKKLIDHVENLDPTYSYGGAYQYWAEMILEVPSFLRSIHGYSLEDGLEFLKKAMEVEPNCFYTHLLLAKTYLKMGKRDKAKEELEWMIDTPIDILPDEVPENRIRKKQAQEIFAKEFQKTKD